MLRAKPDLRRCLKRCRHCRIFFLTDWRNVGRSDLRCPFGCRQEHRKRCSTQRSVAYYRTKRGKFKKKLQNGRRGKTHPKPPSAPPPTDPTPRVSVPASRSRFDPSMVAYVRVVTSLIEDRRVSRGEIVAMLARAVRQHSMARRKRMDYVVSYWKQNPP